MNNIERTKLKTGGIYFNKDSTTTFMIIEMPTNLHDEPNNIILFMLGNNFEFIRLLNNATCPTFECGIIFRITHLNYIELNSISNSKLKIFFHNGYICNIIENNWTMPSEYTTILLPSLMDSWFNLGGARISAVETNISLFEYK